MRSAKLFAASVVALLMSISAAHATLLGYTNCSGAIECLIAPDQIPLPNPIVQNPNNNLLIGWDEVQNYTLTSDLRVDRVADPLASFVGHDGSGYFIKSGTIVSSHYFQWDPASGSKTVNATLQFDSAIFGFITSDANLFASDAQLGLPGLDYADFGLRGLENGDTTNFAPGGDNRLVDISWTASSPGDWTRLITAYSPAAAVPEPSTLALFGASLLGFACRRGRKSV